VKEILILVAGLVVGSGALYVLLPDREPITYTEFRVDTIYGEPDTIRTFVDRIVYRDREPEVAITQPSGATDVVEDFCRPDTVVEVVRGDTVWAPADTVYLLRSVVHDPGWFFQRDNITLFGPTSVGGLQELRFHSYPGWSVRTHPDLIFREPRFGWFRELVEAGVYVGLGYLGGRIIR